MLRKKIDRQIFVTILPHLVRVLIARGHVTREMLGDAKRLDATLRKHKRLASENFSTVVALDEGFARDAFELWDRGRKYPAVVLFATAVEQALNSYYRIAFLACAHTNQEITAIIRTHNLDAKLTWLSRIATNTPFPKALGRRLLALSDIRNSIVHYKAVPWSPDRGADSHQAIENKLRQLGRLSLRRDFQLLQRFIEKTILQHDPSFELAHAVAQQILTYRGYKIRYVTRSSSRDPGRLKQPSDDAHVDRTPTPLHAKHELPPDTDRKRNCRTEFPE
jgi:hypothetical protein